MWFSLAAILLFGNPAAAQDERLWRKVLSGEMALELPVPPPAPRYVFEGPVYRVDLDGDGREEGLRPAKRDLVDWLDVLSHDGRVLYQAPLEALGVDARLDRVRLVDLAPGKRVLILQYFEGKTEARRMEATARLWFLSMDGLDLKTLKLTRGPGYWHEFEAQREQYGRRLYALSVRDVDGDGVKDVSVAYNHVMHVWRYQGNGLWTSF